LSTVAFHQALFVKRLQYDCRRGQGQHQAHGQGYRPGLTQGNADLSFFFGNPGDVILAGDGDGDGDDTVAVYRPSSSRVYVNLENSSGPADYSLYVGRYATAVTWGRQPEA
jgi:hypothetical protein